MGKQILSASHMPDSVALTDKESDLNMFPNKKTHNVGFTFQKYI